MSWDRFDNLLASGMGPWRETLESIANEGPPMPTGVPFLDYNLEGGLHPGVLNVVAGYTHSGKTLLARTMVWCNKQRRVLYLVADEAKRQILLDLAGTALQQRAYQIARDLKQGQATPKMIEETLMDHYPNLFIPDDDLSGASPDDVCSLVDQAQRLWGEPPELIIFDHMGCLSIADGDTSTQGLVHTRIHKQLCRQFPESVWLIISQLNRGAAGGKPTAPTLNRMFGGGEAAIDGAAIGVWRWPEDERSADDVDIMVNVMKAKLGRAAPGGPGRLEDAGENRLRNGHVHTISSRSTIHPKPWPNRLEVVHDIGEDDEF